MKHGNVLNMLQNYAGLVGGDASRSVLMTLEASFGQCRVFHDSMTPVSDEELTSEFRNLVRATPHSHRRMLTSFAGHLLLSVHKTLDLSPGGSSRLPGISPARARSWHIRA